MNTEVISRQIKSQVKEYIDSAKVIDKFLGAQIKEVEKLRIKKKEGASFEDLRQDIVDNFQNSQISAFILEDMKGLLAKMSFIYTIANLADLDLELSDEDNDLLKHTAGESKQLCDYSNGSIEPLNKEIFEAFKAKTSDKYLTDNSLLEIYNSI